MSKHLLVQCVAIRLLELQKLGFKVIFRYAGHVDHLYITIFKDRDAEDKDKVYDQHWSLDFCPDLQSVFTGILKDLLDLECQAIDEEWSMVRR